MRDALICLGSGLLCFAFVCYKVGDSVPVWVSLIGGDLHSLRDGPVKVSRGWIFPAVLGTLVLLIGLAWSQRETQSNPPGKGLDAATAGDLG